MNLPRDINASKLINTLRTFGYETTRQMGSHIRLTTQLNGQHHLTIPNHDPIRIGTQNAILMEVSQHLGVSKQELAGKLF